MAGRSVHVQRAAAGEPTHTDGLTIYLARGAAHAEDLAAIAVQGALLAAESLPADVLGRLHGRPRLARRYLAVEGRRALVASAEVLPPLPVVTEARSAQEPPLSALDSLARASGREPVPGLPPVFGAIRPRRVMANVARQVEDPKAAEPTPLELSQQVTAQVDEDEFESEGAGRPESQSHSRLARWLMRRLGERGEQRDVQRGGNIFMDAGQVINRASGRPTAATMAASLAPVEVQTGGRSALRYPEWDVRSERYRPEWCTVLEVDPDARNRAELHWPDATGLERRLARLGVGLERRRRQPQGEDLDIDAVVEAQVDLRSGMPPAEGLYVENQRHRRSLAVLVLVDVSGSAAERGAGDRTVHAQQLDAARLLLEALHALGDRVALYGFRSHGRAAVEMLRVKRFADHAEGAVYERLATLRPEGYSRFGAAIRHGAHLLATDAGTERRLLVVFSDGFAYDDGYEGRYGEADARRALAESRRQGVGCLCLSLGTTTDAESLRRVFGTAAYAHANEFDELMRSIGGLFRSALASADLQRRLAQRERPAA